MKEPTCLFNEYFIFQLNGEAIKKASTKCCKIRVDGCSSHPETGTAVNRKTSPQNRIFKKHFTVYSLLGDNSCCLALMFWILFWCHLTFCPARQVARGLSGLITHCGAARLGRILPEVCSHFDQHRWKSIVITTEHQLNPNVQSQLTNGKSLWQAH